MILQLNYYIKTASGIYYTHIPNAVLFFPNTV